MGQSTQGSTALTMLMNKDEFMGVSCIHAHVLMLNIEQEAGDYINERHTAKI